LADNEHSHGKPDTVNELEEAIKVLIKIKEFNDLIPQVGSNMVYSKPNPKNARDIAGIEGRIIRGKKSVMLCGGIDYDVSTYLASVVLEANRLNRRILAALNICGREDIPALLEKAELSYLILPSKCMDDGCPVTYHLKNTDKLLDAYVHPGDFGIEPTTTILAENPGKLVEIIYEMVKRE